MAVAVADSIQADAGASYTAAAGSNRLIVWAASVTGNSGGIAPTITSPMFGVVAMTEAVTVVSTVFRAPRASIFYLKEASIPSGSQVINATYANEDGAPRRGFIYTLTGVDQTTPLVDSDVIFTGAGASTMTLPAVDVEASGISIISAAKQADSDTWNTPAGYTKHALGNFPVSGNAVAYEKLISGAGTEAPTITFTSAVGAAALASFRQVGAADTLMGQACL